MTFPERGAQYPLNPNGVFSQANAFAVTPGDTAYNVVRQNARNILVTTRNSSGVSGTWSTTPSSTWSVALFVRMDRPVLTVGAYAGAGPMTLLRSASVGLAVSVPSGGAVPAGATVAGGGPLDGTMLFCEGQIYHEEPEPSRKV